MAEVMNADRALCVLMLGLGLSLGACGDDTGPSDAGNGSQDTGQVVDDSGTPLADGGVLADANGGPDAGDPGVCAFIGTALPMGTAPARRGDMAFAIDPVCKRVFMYSGDRAEPVMCGPAASTFVDDLHVYDMSRQTWALLSPDGDKPLPRARSRGIWDPNREQFVVFGGRWRQGTSGQYTYLNDVWGYDPVANTWTELAPFAASPVNGPTGRMNFGMSGDPERDRFIITQGGQVAANFTEYEVEGDTWAFDLEARSWTEIGANSTNRPVSRLFHVTALDRQRQHLYILGGAGSDALTNPMFMRDLWTLDMVSGEWSEVAQTLLWPTGRIKAEMSYDAARDQLVMYGGHDDTPIGNNSEVWTFNLQTSNWALRSAGDTLNPNRAPSNFCDFPYNFVLYDLATPERRESHLFEIDGDLAFMYAGRTDCGLSNDSWALDLTSYTWTLASDSFNGLTCPRQGRNDCEDIAVNHCGGVHGQ